MVSPHFVDKVTDEMATHLIPGVTLLTITQATTATFTDVYIKNTALFFIENGSKRVAYSGGYELIGQKGDVIIFPPDSVVTIENRTWSGIDYRAVGVTFNRGLVQRVFPNTRQSGITHGVQVISPPAGSSEYIVASLKESYTNTELPELLREHRLMEPLVWLKSMGVALYTVPDSSPLGKVRTLIESDLTHAWRSREVAEHFAMSEATMRRWLAQSGGSFSRILINARLERGLSLLQTTDRPITEIALDCGFKTPSHFSDSFKSRFGIQPRALRSPLK